MFARQAEIIVLLRKSASRGLAMGFLSGLKGFNPFNYLGELGDSQPNQSGNQIRARRTGVSSMAAGGARNAGEARVTGTMGSISPDPNVGSFDGSPPGMVKPAQPPAPMVPGADGGGLPINSSMGSPDVNFSRGVMPPTLPGLNRNAGMSADMAAMNGQAAAGQTPIDARSIPGMRTMPNRYGASPGANGGGIPNLMTMEVRNSPSSMAPLPPTARNPRLTALSERLGRIGMGTRPVAGGGLGNTGGFVDEVYQSPREAAAEQWKEKGGIGTRIFEGLQGFLSGGLMGGIQGARGIPWQERQAAAMEKDRAAQRQGIQDQLGLEKVGIEQEGAQRRSDIDARQADIQGRTLESNIANQQREGQAKSDELTAKAKQWQEEQELKKAEIYGNAMRDPQIKWNNQGFDPTRFGGLFAGLEPAPPKAPNPKDNWTGIGYDAAGNATGIQFSPEGDPYSKAIPGVGRTVRRSAAGGGGGRSSGTGGGDKVANRQKLKRDADSDKQQLEDAAAIAMEGELKKEIRARLSEERVSQGGAPDEPIDEETINAAVAAEFKSPVVQAKIRERARRSKGAPQKFQMQPGGFYPGIYGVHGSGR